MRGDSNGVAVYIYIYISKFNMLVEVLHIIFFWKLVYI